ncbi:PadR family transcriptional regulator [Alteribacillus sp. HJP-4]|uniref:PadR family transcriptional regulator n=1 Tax=Alteribacillus sp. HJP-4 TaxID=2775394 RepID=UPI0035CCD74B
MYQDFFSGFIKIHILHHAKEEPVYGKYLIDELASHGYRVSPGTIYPVLHDMQKKGYLSRKERNVEGRIRKYYTITNHGLTALEETKAKIRELMKEVMDE